MLCCWWLMSCGDKWFQIYSLMFMSLSAIIAMKGSLNERPQYRLIYIRIHAKVHQVFFMDFQEFSYLGNFGKFGVVWRLSNAEIPKNRLKYFEKYSAVLNRLSRLNCFESRHSYHLAANSQSLTKKKTYFVADFCARLKIHLMLIKRRKRNNIG